MNVRNVLYGVTCACGIIRSKNMRIPPRVFWTRSTSCLSCFRFNVKQPTGRTLVLRRMSDHMERTAHNLRQPGASVATIISIKDASPTVKLLTLRVTNPQFHFKAGQWVDFFIPGIEIFTGFSMTSSSKKLKQDSTFDLAVQKSDYPPTLWVHTQCKAGGEVSVRVGGDQIIYDPSASDPQWDVLLIAGGIGINPLYSILQHIRDLQANSSTDSMAYRPGRVEFLYSASCMDELIFKDSIETIVADMENVSCQFFITKEKIMPSSYISGHRINEPTIAASLQRLNKDRLQCFICGPPPMIADMESHLASQGIRPDQVHCEKWW